MGPKEDREILRKNGFAEHEVIQLSKLRTYYAEQVKRETQADTRRLEADTRRLEFVRWLVSRGKLSDQIA
jgi:hypothetical protein